MPPCSPDPGGFAHASMLSQVNKPQALLTLEPGMAGSENLFKSLVEIIGKSGSKKIFPYPALLSALHHHHNLKPPQNKGS